MIAIIFYVVIMISSFVWIGGLQIRDMTDHNAIFVIWLLTLVVWGGILVGCAREALKEHLKNLAKLKEYDTDAYIGREKLKLYKEEMKRYLLETYPAYEEKLIRGITDSKLLATIIEKEGYSKVVQSYDNNIKNLMNDIATSQKSKSRAIAEIEAFQNDTWGWALFIPKRFRYEEV